MKGLESFSEEEAENAKALMWCIGTLNQFKDMKIIKGLDTDITPRGISEWDQLDADWKPKDEHVLLISNFLGLPNEIVELLFSYRDERDEMLKMLDYV